MTEGELIYAGMGRRALAFALDITVFVACFFTVAMGTDPGHWTSDYTEAMGRLAAIAWIGYMVLAVRLTRTTLGKYVLGMELLTSRPGRGRPAIWELAMRESVFRWLSLLLLAGYIPAFSDRRRRSWSDRWANTVVVRRAGEPKRWIVIAFGCYVALVMASFGLVWISSQTTGFR